MGSIANGFGQLSLGDPSPPAPTLVFTNLKPHTTHDELNTILLFASEDIIDLEIVPPTDQQISATGYARFRTLEAATKAHDLLQGKINVKLSASPVPAGANGTRRNTVDSASTCQTSIPSSLTSPASTSSRPQHSRFFDTSNLDSRSPPNGSASTANGAATTNWGLPQSPPIGTTVAARNVGRTMITGEGNDDDGLLQEAVGQGTSSSAPQPAPRRPTNPSVSMPPLRHGLSLNTNGTTPMSPSLHHIATNGHMSPPLSNFSGNGPMSPQGMSQYSSNISTPATSVTPMSGVHRSHPGFPPAFPSQSFPPPPYNPSDQNPPCNTLYVGNLPANTNEDELKQLFLNRTRGFKRLCYRVKANGPMCFVEFEDVTMATRALNELYGCPLSNSVKGGIRLSFSKNPLGVRSNPQPATGSASGVNPGGMSTYGAPISAPPGLTRPPPGLPVPSQSNPGYPYTNGISGQGHNNGYVQRPSGAIGQAPNGQFASISGAGVGQAPGGPYNHMPNNGVGLLPNGTAGARNDPFASRRNDVGSDDSSSTITNNYISNGGPATFNGHYYAANGHNPNGH